MNDDEGFISEESDYNNFQIKLPDNLLIEHIQQASIPIHKIDYKCIYLKHKQISTYNFKYHFNGLLTNQQKLQYTKPIIDLGIFDSTFECANLYAAYEIQQNEYILILQDDINTVGYSQWFYFQVTNNTNHAYTLHIINLMKDYKQLRYGMTIMIYDNNQWKLLDTNVKFKLSQYYKLKYPANINKLYSLTITIPSKYKIYKLSLNHPYSNQDLYNYLNNNYQTISYSLTGLSVPYLEYGNQQNQTIIIIARQHPGETVSSFVCQGFIDSITKDKKLTEQFHVLIFPLFNPDGVQWGNFRCDITGKDLNRSWHKPNPDQMQIIETKKLINQIIQQKNITCFIDLHGHSKNLNSFVYACRGDQDVVECRALPYIFQQQSKYFDFKQCTFSLEPCKMKTARAFVYKLVKKYYPDEIHNIFTLETSFFGYKYNNQTQQFTTQDLLNIGNDLYKTLILYYQSQQYKYEILQELEKNRFQFQQQDLCKLDEQSDSDPENGLMIQKNQKEKNKKKVDKKNQINKDFNLVKKFSIGTTTQQQNNFMNTRYFSMPKSKLETRQLKSQSFHNQLNITQAQLKDYSTDITPTNKFKLRTQQSSNVQEQDYKEQQSFIGTQKKQNFSFQRNNIIPPIHNGQSIRIIYNKQKQEQLFQQQQQIFQQPRHNTQLNKTQYNSPDNKNNLVLISKSIQKKDTWDPRLIFEFTQKVKRKNTQTKIF